MVQDNLSIWTYYIQVHLKLCIYEKFEQSYLQLKNNQVKEEVIKYKEEVDKYKALYDHAEKVQAVLQTTKKSTKRSSKIHMRNKR